jgi:hypothetical protein
MTLPENKFTPRAFVQPNSQMIGRGVFDTYLSHGGDGTRPDVKISVYSLTLKMPK